MKTIQILAVFAAIVLAGCGQSDSTTKQDSGNKTTPTEQLGSSAQQESVPTSPSVAKFDISEASDFKCGDSTGLKLHLKLTGNMDTNLTIHANEIRIETKKGDYSNSWKFTQFFSNVKTKAQVQMTTLQIDNTYPMVQWVDDDAELIFELKAGQESEADLLFFGVDKSQAKSFHFGSIPAVKIK